MRITFFGTSHGVAVVVRLSVNRNVPALFEPYHQILFAYIPPRLAFGQHHRLVIDMIGAHARASRQRQTRRAAVELFSAARSLREHHHVHSAPEIAPRFGDYFLSTPVVSDKNLADHR